MHFVTNSNFHTSQFVFIVSFQPFVLCLQISNNKFILLRSWSIFHTFSIVISFLYLKLYLELVGNPYLRIRIFLNFKNIFDLFNCFCFCFGFLLFWFFVNFEIGPSWIIETLVALCTLSVLNEWFFIYFLSNNFYQFASWRLTLNKFHLFDLRWLYWQFFC
jgi:hypothetical protein